MKRELLAVGVTVGVLATLLFVAAPTSAIETTVAGPEVVTDDETVEFNATVEMEGDETVENYTLEVITTKTNESVNVTVAPNGTVLSFEPEEGIVGNHGIKVAELEETLNVTVVEEPRAAGYGYGENGAGDVGLLIEFHTRSFVPGGVYALQLHTTTTDGGAFSSNVAEFEVTRENGEG